MTEQTITRTYSVSDKKQLIDLNDSMINFHIQFTLTSTNAKPFEAVVVNQSTLDEGSPLQFQLVTGGLLSGEILSDKNVYQNYFLVLKAPENVDVTVELKVIHLPDYVAPPNETSPPKQEQQTSNRSTKLWDWIASNEFRLVVLVCIVASGLYYYVYKEKKSHQNPSTEHVLPSSTAIPPQQQSLLEKLKNVSVQ